MLWLMLVSMFLLQVGSLGAATLYDDFSADYIKKSMWLDHHHGSRVNEKVREIDTANQSLVLKLGTNEGKFPSRTGIAAKGPFDLTAIKADVKIVEMNNDPTDTGTVFARVAGQFYNTQSASAGDLTGNVWAELCVGDRGNGLEAWFAIEEFTGPNTTDVSLLIQKEIAAGATLSLNTFYTLEIAYDGDNILTFTVSDGTTELESVGTDELTTELPSGLPARVGAPYGDIAYFQVAVLDDQDEFVDGYVHAEVDNISVNDGAITDTFDGDQIDATKWNGLEYVRESIDGSARLNVRGAGRPTRSVLYLKDAYSSYLEATLHIEGDSEISESGWGQMRIGGVFYNEMYGPGDYNGSEGNVWATIELNIDSDGAMWASVYLAKDSNSAGSEYETLYDEAFEIQILAETDYVLSINYTETGFEFSCNDETMTYEIGTPTRYAPSSAMRWIESILILEDGMTGYLKGRVDNVRVDDPVYTNLNGAWTGDLTNVAITGGCDQGEDATGEYEISQNGCEIIFRDGETLESLAVGVLSGSRLLVNGSELTAGVFVEYGYDLTISDAENGTGSMTATWSNGCDGTGDMTVAKAASSSGGGGSSGGGCFIKALQF